jgi:hypothetical protein
MLASTSPWISYEGGDLPLKDEDDLVDIRFSSGKVIERVNQWDVKLNGNNPGFGYVEAYRLSEKNRNRS